ncbi:Histidine kinase-, DNA gyrase B-, and HSP90-like ATPase [Sporobacter termitidis DSM 10068]|uniref:Histidine kinase-, DNA gyrase B-, and HSP90-like ATPase n=1 Tax=Sporobacter termitidis DSM 10068 TaxID=1123282 RepID=A0A1M5Z466_9FIRM|nr:histidine kinase [Sporobacter termitidis]SHI19035.1 Histidine kinase-, DNA gyrase B-, and HSP90-like ATPase [Sporobacter termitidis DSM 10068]
MIELAFIFISIKYFTFAGCFIMSLGLLICLCSAVIAAAGIKNKVPDAWLNMLNIIILTAAYVHDVIRPGKSIYLFAVYLVLIMQMLAQARRIKLYHEQKTIAELSFLQAQIKPHFLYNVMNTIISVSRYDIDKTRDLMYDFNTYLRNSFDIKNVHQLVGLGQEMALVEAYLKIEKVRFEERLDFNMELPDSVDYLVPPLIIQPIIENAVNHGVLSKPEGGRVELKIAIKNKNMEFSVKDNGIGMTAKQISEITVGRKEGGVGLANIQSRLKILYNEQLRIKSTFGAGTEITWQIPINARKGYFHAQCNNHR